jgi:hypothetical protein
MMKRQLIMKTILQALLKYQIYYNIYSGALCVWFDLFGTWAIFMDRMEVIDVLNYA